MAGPSVRVKWAYEPFAFVILKIRISSSAVYKIPAKLKVKALNMLDTW